MEIKLSPSIALSFLQASAMFFKGRSFAATQDTFFKLFHCWSANDCQSQADLTEQEFAMFCDELISLVSASYVVYQAHRADIDQGGYHHA